MVNKKIPSKKRKIHIENALEFKTVSGLDPSVLETPGKSHYASDIFDLYHPNALNFLTSKLSDSECQNLLIKMSQYESVGSFLENSSTQELELAAYALITIDRFVQAAVSNVDGWEAMFILDQILECMEFVLVHKQGISIQAKKRAKLRHKETDKYKANLKKWYAKNHAQYSSMDAAAADACKIEPVKFRTARTWIGEFNKELRSARRV